MRERDKFLFLFFLFSFSLLSFSFFSFFLFYFFFFSMFFNLLRCKVCRICKPVTLPFRYNASISAFPIFDSSHSFVRRLLSFLVRAVDGQSAICFSLREIAGRYFSRTRQTAALTTDRKQDGLLKKHICSLQGRRRNVAIFKFTVYANYSIYKVYKW